MTSNLKEKKKIIFWEIQGQDGLKMGYHPFCSPLGYCDLGSLIPPPAYDFFLGPLLPLLHLKPWCTQRANLSPLLSSLHVHIFWGRSLSCSQSIGCSPVLGLQTPLQATSPWTTPFCTPFALIHLVTSFHLSCDIFSLVQYRLPCTQQAPCME